VDLMHDRLTLIIPSYRRPAAAALAARSAIDNAVLPGTQVLIAVDGPHDLQHEQAYAAIATPRIGVIFGSEWRGMVGTLNSAANLITGTELAADHTCQSINCTRIGFVGFMGDDHRVRTEGWDRRLCMLAYRWGISYGNDLIQGSALPTALVMAADIVRTLRFMGPPEIEHLYVDNYWMALGLGLKTLGYDPDTVIEHLHVSVGKAPDDESYARTNSAQQYERDGTAWREYCTSGAMERDIAAVQAARERS
jgi:hypothetical protein